MNIRKIITILLSLILVFTLLTACSQPSESNTESSNSASPEASESATEAATESITEATESAQTAGSDIIHKIGIIQLAENGAFTAMREGFLGELEAKGIQVEADYKNAQGDVGTLNTICQEMAASDNEIVVTIATPAAQAYVSQESDIPLFFISVTNPVGAGIMGSLDTPDHNATGTSNLVPVDEIFSLAEKLTPDAKDFGILYNTGETNAVQTVANAKAYLDENGYTYTEATVTNSSEIQQAAQTLASKAQAIYVPIDSMIQTGMAQVAQIATDAGIPVYGSSPVMVQDGALATVSVDDALIGALTADMAIEYFNGKAVEDIPAVAVSEFYSVINEATAAALGITIPDDLSDAVLMGS